MLRSIERCRTNGGGGTGCDAFRGGFPFYDVSLAGYSPRRATPFFASPKKGGKKGDPASPVVRYANDSPALLASGGRRGTRRLRLLRQPRRKAPPAAVLLGGSERAFRKHRAITEAGFDDERKRRSPNVLHPPASP